MIITCPNCATRYQVADTAIGDGGRTVRCAKCGHSWVATPDLAEAMAGEAPPPIAEPPPPVAEPAPPPPAPETQAAPLYPGAEPGPPPEPEPVPESPVHVRMVRPRAIPEAPPARSRRLVNLLSWLVFLAVIAAIVGGGYKYRQQFIEMWPPVVRLYETLGVPVELPAGYGLAIAVEQTRRETDLGDPVLVLEGSIQNRSGRERPVPSVRVTLLAGSQEVQEWSFTPDKRSLKPGESVPFTTRVRKPDPAATDVRIVFTAGE